MSDSPGTIDSSAAAGIPVPAKKTHKTTWAEIAVCTFILGMALYFVMFAVLLADAMFFDRNLVLKTIQNSPPAVRNFIMVIYYPEIVLLKVFRIIPE